MNIATVKNLQFRPPWSVIITNSVDLTFKCNLSATIFTIFPDNHVIILAHPIGVADLIT